MVVGTWGRGAYSDALLEYRGSVGLGAVGGAHGLTSGSSGEREFAQNFRGPVAKHRMAVSTVGCLLSIVEHLRMEGKEVGAMPGNRTTKKSAPYMFRRARVAGGVGISSAKCPAIEVISVCPGLESCSASSLGGRTEQMRQRRKRGAIRDNRRRWNAPKGGRLAVRESEIRHGKFCVD